MKRHGHKQAKACSKYSLGVVYAGLTSKFDTFKETMEKIREIRFETLKNRFRKTNLKEAGGITKTTFKKENIKDIIKKHIPTNPSLNKYEKGVLFDEEII